MAILGGAFYWSVTTLFSADLMCRKIGKAIPRQVWSAGLERVSDCCRTVGSRIQPNSLAPDSKHSTDTVSPLVE